MKSLVFLTVLVLAVNGQDQTYPWTVSMKVADIHGNDYFGGMEMDLVLKDFSRLNLTLPLQQYSSGSKYSFNVQLASSNPLQYAIIRTIGFCDKSMPLEVLRLDWVEFKSQVTQSAYMKRLNNVAVKDKCQLQRGTVLIDFEESASEKCEINGKSYSNGEAFSVGCVMRCSCNKGNVGCVDMCPPFNWLRSPNYTCREINVVGACCPTIKCVDKQGRKMNGSSGSASSNDRQCSDPKDLMKREYDYGFPSMVLVQQADTVRSAVILNSNWVLMRGLETFNASNLFVYAKKEFDSNYTQFKVKQIVKDETYNLLLLQVADLPASLTVQPTNLPITTEHCANLVAESCRSASLSFEYPAKGYTLESSKNDIRWITRTIVKPAVCSDDRSILCMASPEEECPVGNGDPLFVSDGEVNFLVGLQQQTPQDPHWICQKRELAVGVNVCSSLDWIRKIINSL